MTKKTTKPNKKTKEKRQPQARPKAKTTAKKSVPIGDVIEKRSKRATEEKKKPPQRKKAAGVAKNDSIEQSVAVAQAAFREIEPPAHVRFRDKDYFFWNEIIAKFAKADWDEADLTVAALLARSLSDMEREQYLMRREGGILEKKAIIERKDPKTGEITQELVTVGTYLNPRKTLMAEHSKNILAFRRTLSLHARATEGEARDAGKRRATAKKLQDDILSGEDDEDDLLAKPGAYH